MVSPHFVQALLALRSLGNAMSHGGRFRLPQSILRRVFRFAGVEATVSDFDGALYMRLRLSEHMQRRIFWVGYYSNDIVALLKRELKPGMVAVDVGANIGEITLVAAQCVGESGRVLAFEPVSVVADKLAEHVQVNNLNQVIMRREALGKGCKYKVPIYESCGQGVSDENQGLSSLYGENNGTEPIEYVDITTLDEIAESLSLTKVDLIKIDVEGGELACLQGAESVLRRFRPMLIVEVQEFSASQAGWDVKELFQYLSEFEYEFYSIGAKGCLVPLDVEALADFQNVFCSVGERHSE